MIESSFILLRELGGLQLSEQEEVRFSIDAYRGYRYVSVRRYVKTDGFSGPTRDGVTLTPEIVRALVPKLLALPTDVKQLKLGTIGKFAKRPGICVVVTISEFRGSLGLELRNWSQEKGWSKNGIWLALTYWTQTRELFKNALAAIDEMPEVDF